MELKYSLRLTLPGKTKIKKHKGGNWQIPEYGKLYRTLKLVIQEIVYKKKKHEEEWPIGKKRLKRHLPNIMYRAHLVPDLNNLY